MTAASRSAPSADTRSVRPGAAAACVVLLLAYIGWLAYANLFAPPKPWPITRQARITHDWIKSLSEKSGGDINKLGIEERQYLMKITNGMGAGALKRFLKEPYLEAP